MSQNTYIDKKKRQAKSKQNNNIQHTCKMPVVNKPATSGPLKRDERVSFACAARASPTNDPSPSSALTAAAISSVEEAGAAGVDVAGAEAVVVLAVVVVVAGAEEGADDAVAEEEEEEEEEEEAVAVGVSPPKASWYSVPWNAAR